MSGQIVHAQESDQPSVERLIRNPDRPQLPFSELLLLLQGIFNALDPSRSLIEPTNPSPTLPSPSPTPGSSLTPEEIEQVICVITGDCEPQTDPGGNGGQCTPPPSPPPTCGENGPLEGEREYQVFDPSDSGRTITDIDRFEGNILWEEKQLNQL